jgi:hypothetical protein
MGNGKVYDAEPVLRANCGKGGKKGKHGRHGRAALRHRRAAR